MDRKEFLLASGTIAAGRILSAPPTFSKPHRPKPFVIPPYLKPGSVIGLTAPAGFITLEEMLIELVL